MRRRQRAAPARGVTGDGRKVVAKAGRGEREEGILEDGWGGVWQIGTGRVQGSHTGLGLFSGLILPI